MPKGEKTQARSCAYGHRDSCNKVEDMQALLIKLANLPCVETEGAGCVPCHAQSVLTKYEINW